MRVNHSIIDWLIDWLIDWILVPLLIPCWFPMSAFQDIHIHGFPWISINIHGDPLIEVQLPVTWKISLAHLLDVSHPNLDWRPCVFESWFPYWFPYWLDFGSPIDSPIDWILVPLLIPYGFPTVLAHIFATIKPYMHKMETLTCICFHFVHMWPNCCAHCLLFAFILCIYAWIDVHIDFYLVWTSLGFVDFHLI